jgi:hypothetical protein
MTSHIDRLNLLLVISHTIIIIKRSQMRLEDHDDSKIDSAIYQRINPTGGALICVLNLQMWKSIFFF